MFTNSLLVYSQCLSASFRLFRCCLQLINLRHKMKNEVSKLFASIIFAVIIVGIGYFIFMGISNYVGWYGYEKWKYRVGTDSIENSKKRNVFVKELNYKIIDGKNLNDFKFTPYIERAFRYGKHSSRETVIDKYTKFPYNLSYERNKNDSIALDIINKEKLDSSNVVWGYLKNPSLKDTIIIKIEGAKDKNNEEKSGIIKIW